MLRISSDFECGSIGCWTTQENNIVKFQASLDNGRKAMWFYFRVEGATLGEYTFVLTNLHECLGKTEWGYVRPVYRRPNDEWKQVSSTNTKVNFEEGQFMFTLFLTEEPMEVAYSYPYSTEDLDLLLKKLLKDDLCILKYPGNTKAGRPIPYIKFLCTGRNNPKGCIWLLAREHAGEVSGSYALEGLLMELLNHKIREDFEFHVVPMIDLDGVVEGRYGKASYPVDHGVSWYSNSPWPEVQMTMKLMDESICNKTPIKLLLNFHSPTPEDQNYLYFGHLGLLSQEMRIDLEKLVYHLERTSPYDFPITISDAKVQQMVNWYTDDSEGLAIMHVAQMYNTIGVIIETSYHSVKGIPSTPQKRMDLGKGVLHGVYRFLKNEPAKPLGLFHSLSQDYLNSKDYILWSNPRGCLIRAKENLIGIKSKEKSCSFNIAFEKMCSISREIKVEIAGTFNGSLDVIWHMYNDRGKRVFIYPPVSDTCNSVNNKGTVILNIPTDLPKDTSFIRPGLKGYGKYFDVEVRVINN